jgi:precorrin-3B synthase
MITPRGACPSLLAPMPTGDGLLVRLPALGLPPAAWVGLAKVAAAHGNGQIEITARGSVQLRGLTAATLAPLATALAALGIDGEASTLLASNALAGHDSTMLADPRPITAAIAAGAPAAHAPKLSVVVDGGGALHLDAVAADIRLRAQPGGASWWLFLAEAYLGATPAPGEAALLLLACLGPTGRGRTLPPTEARAALGHLLHASPPPPARPPAEPLGHHAEAFGVAAAFGQMRAETLGAFAQAAGTAPLLRAAPGRALLAIRPADPRALEAAAAALGLVTAPGDPRRAVHACPGAPACASALMPTRQLAEASARQGIAGLHVSGCAKGCAHPGASRFTLVGAPGGFGLVRDGDARGTPGEHLTTAAALPRLLALQQGPHAT